VDRHGFDTGFRGIDTIGVITLSWSGGMHWLMVVVLLVGSGVLPAAAQSLPDAPLPSQLAFDRDEVNAHARQTWDDKLRQEAAAGQLGCRHHCERIQRLFAQLADAAARVGGEHRMRWELAVGTNPREDAWALSGGLIYVSEAFIDAFAMDDAQLAFVLAHEMGHALLEHDNQALTLAQALLPHGVTRSVENLFAQVDYDLGLALNLQPELQAEEFEADRAGLMIACVAGHDGAAQLGFLEQLAADANDGRGSLLRTHPDAVERLARARAFLPSAQRWQEQMAEGNAH
jgi:predicted Zn-dependent protease